MQVQGCGGVTDCGDVGHVDGFCSCGFGGALCGSGLAELALLICCRDVAVTVPAPAGDGPGVDSADGRDGLDAWVGGGSLDRDSAAGADAEDADVGVVDVGQGRQVVHGAVDVTDAVHGVVQEAGHAAAGALIRRVEGQGDEALIGEPLRIDAGGLLLDSTTGVHDHDGGVGAVGVEVGGDEDVARHGDVAVLEFDGLHRGPPGNRCREITWD